MPAYLDTIIEKCKHNDRRAQKELFSILAPNLLSVSRHYSPRGVDPMDTLQDSFIKIFSHLDKYDDSKGSIESWSRKIVINTSLDKINKNLIEESIHHFEDKEFPLDINFENDYDTEHLMQMIERLPDGYKQVFCLFEIEGYSHKEIADQLNIKESTSRSQLSRGKQLLQTWITNNEKSFLLKFQKIN